MESHRSVQLISAVLPTLILPSNRVLFALVYQDITVIRFNHVIKDSAATSTPATKRYTAARAHC
jgi:hypothetical protein